MRPAVIKVGGEEVGKSQKQTPVHPLNGGRIRTAVFDVSDQYQASTGLNIEERNRYIFSLKH